MSDSPPRVLIIAGSDPSGGAGIQADIKTVTMLGGYAMAAITALTVQNTQGVQHVAPLSPSLVVAQIAACYEDIGVDAVKIGMVGSGPVAQAVAEWLEHHIVPQAIPIVFDPVMAATNGGVLADGATCTAFVRLLSLSTLATPNLPEMAALCRMIGGDEAGLLARVAACLVTGGHGVGDRLVDRLLRRHDAPLCWEHPRIATRHTHGTGCTLASAIATALGAGVGLEHAVAQAIAFVRQAILAAPGFGAGHGPLGHYAATPKRE